MKKYFLTDLNPDQSEAVNYFDGPLLILAGAGTGKTKVLTSRIANLIAQNIANSKEILAVTFTNKAAREMLERLENIIESEGIWLGTFHSIAAKILRKHADLIGLNNNFSIIDYEDQVRLVKNISNEEQIDEKKYPPKIILSIIQKWKDLGITYNKLSESDLKKSADSIAKRIYVEYQYRLRKANMADFGDLLLYNIELFNKYDEILNIYQQKFRYILVDEYQDTNVIQYLWLRLLSSAHKNICCVGDDDQSIYSWRGAEIANILRFSDDFPGAKIIRLEQNYRSTGNILKAASNLIANNNSRFKKILWTSGISGPKVKIISLWDEKEEPKYIAEILESKKSKYKFSEYAILVRAGFQTRAFEEYFIAKSIPYKIIGGQRFYERKEIKDIIAYIRLIIFHNDNLAFERIINVPKRNIGKASLEEIKDYAKTNKLSFFESAKEMIDKKIFSKKANLALAKFLQDTENWRLKFDIRDHNEVIEIIAKESGYIEMLEIENTIESESKIENIKELMNAIKEFNNITEFLEHISLITDNDDKSSGNYINIMTLHGAKGLEFKVVFLPGWEEGLFPHQKSLEENENIALEEERRLAYVGITRAREELYILYTLNRRIFNKWQNSTASRFIAELGEDSTELIENDFLKRLNNTSYSKTHISNITLQETKQIINNKFNINDNIYHKIFGYGTILSVNNENAEVHFKHLGVKKLALNYLVKVKK